jgi:hypothetical protein
MNAFLHKLYEGTLSPKLPPLYKLNPCDGGALVFLRFFGYRLAGLTTECPCCAGARILLAFIVGAALPTTWALSLGGLWFIGNIIRAAVDMHSARDTGS